MKKFIVFVFSALLVAVSAYLIFNIGNDTTLPVFAGGTGGFGGSLTGLVGGLLSFD
ncbi:MAG: hypothetical protein RR246_00435 [Clostridia bacterium]